MAEEAIFTGEQGALWVQIGGPNTKPVFLGCHEVDDVSESLGGLNLIQCFDVNGNYKTVRSTRDAPDPVTTSISTYIGQVVDVLEAAKCDFTIFLHQRCGGRADIFGNYDRSTVLNASAVTQITRSNLVKRDEKAASEHSFDISAQPPVLSFFKFRSQRVSISETQDITDITYCNEFRCQGPCSTAKDVCQDGVATAGPVLSSAAGTGNVLFATNGSNFTASAADPFGTDEVPNHVLCFEVDKITTRVIVFRATTDGANPAELAYTQDSGVTWTNVNIGSVNGQYITSSFALDGNNIWVGTDDGYIYFSDDNGDTWTLQEAGVITATAINGIHFINELKGIAGGVGDVIMFTLDGGTTWSATLANTGTGNDIGPVFMKNQDKWWVAPAGTLYYTDDAGATWNIRSFPTSGSGTVTEIDFLNDLFGAISQDTGSNGYVYTTIDGGFHWELVQNIPSNNGFSAVHICATDLLYAAGDASGGTGFILKVTTV